ncbi:MAG: DNA mismatch repair endonuclease MutL [Deltaproteobacteria bacterium]|jgi:DNA mismatch repair protein MutL|nr:DNA mismatch repair endonuclease MutL [Deltaproteobacteria bacterium]
MGIIRKLSKQVIEKIAAGEVIERPASVVKELIENSIDAGAKSIRIDVTEAGKKHLSVIDDGVGMGAEDLANCVQRHATSKILGENDLWNIVTMGFRGEALAAIGAVSNMSIESKPNLDDIIEGARMEISGGTAEGPFPSGCVGGTQVVVSDLFFNVPARMKFLKSESVEYGHIVEVVTSLALANPSIRFELSGENKRGLKVQAVGDDHRSNEERIVSILGERYRGKLTRLDEDGGSISIRGWIAEEGRAAGKDVHVFLNSRAIRDRMIMHALATSLGDGTERNRYPAAVLWIDVDPGEIDVNVHPSKREVRFSNSSAVHEFVKAAVRKMFTGGGRPVCGEPCTGKFANDFNRNEYALRNVIDDSAFTNRDFQEFQHSIPSSHDVKLRPLGQLGFTYVLCEDEDGTLVLIDQHAAHERLGFDTLKKQYASSQVIGQRLLIPENIELGAKELGYINDSLDALAEAGFEIEPFGGNTIVVKTVPEMLSGVSMEKIFLELARELEEIGTSNSVDETIDRIFAVIACHGQVRRGDKLSHAELINLVRDIEKENVTHCPHGRPAMVRVDQDEIEKWFKRKT